MNRKQVLICAKHPTYKGIMPPRANCSACDIVYITTETPKA